MAAAAVVDVAMAAVGSGAGDKPARLRIIYATRFGVPPFEFVVFCAGLRVAAFRFFLERARLSE